MMTNAIETFNHRQPYTTDASGKNVFTRRTPLHVAPDIVELSEQAKLHLVKSKVLTDHKSWIRFKSGIEREIWKLIERSISDHDLRNARIRELREETLKGEYDFNDEDKLSGVADLLLTQL
jgi:hypothetical protein